MKAFALIALGVALVGCGGSGDDDDEATGSIVGKWAFQGSNGCALGFTADAMQYEGDVVCPLADNAYGIEAEVGSYSIAGSQLTLTPELASCPTSDHSVDTITFAVSGNTLKFTTPSGVVVFQKVPGDAGGSVVAAYGCLDVSAGQFTQHDIGPI